MQHADDVVGLVLPQRQTGVRALDRRADDLGRRQVGVDRAHLLAVRDDFRDFHIRQVEDRAQHGPLVAHLLALAGVQVDGAAQLLLRMLGAQGRRHLDAEQLEGGAHQHVHGVGDRKQQEDDHPQDRRHLQRQAIRVVDRVGLRQDLGENQDQECHDDHRIDDARVAEQADQHAGGERRGHDVDQVVAQQDRTDQPLLPTPQRVDQVRPAVALAGQRVHSRDRCRGQRGLRPRKERGQHEQRQDGGDGNQDFHFHGCRLFLEKLSCLGRAPAGPRRPARSTTRRSRSSKGPPRRPGRLGRSGRRVRYRAPARRRSGRP